MDRSTCFFSHSIDNSQTKINKKSDKPKEKRKNSRSKGKKGGFSMKEMTMAPAAMKQINNENLKKNRIQVSNTKKPLFFYVNLAKRYLQQHTEIELSALGMAITTVVTIAEILKNNGFAKEKGILTSTVGMKDQDKGRVVHKARIEIVLEKSEKFDSLMSASQTVQQSAYNGKVIADEKAVANGKVENK